MTDVDARPITVAVASGKGGTGKTLVATNLAWMLAREGRLVTLVDCDVQAPNDHLFFETGEAQVTEVFVPHIEVDAERCTACGACRDACAYGALRVLGSTVMVFDELCHGCGLCLSVCPQLALTETPRRIGEVRRADVLAPGALVLVGGRIDIGEVRSPEVVRVARERALREHADVIVLDTPPGVACTAVASVHGADLLLLVSEDTPFGLHDLRLSIDLAQELGIPAAVMENRAGPMAEDPSRSMLETLCFERGVPIWARIPFDRRIAETYARGGLVLDESERVQRALADVADAMWRQVGATHEVGTP